jgi:hypothetical protein
MSPAFSGSTPIRPERANPLDIAIHDAGRKLLGLRMTRLWGEATKSDAQSVVRDLLDIARIVDTAILEIGREAKAHIGHDVDLSLFADQLLGALEGNATFTLCAAIEAREEEIEAAIGDGDTPYKLARDAA